MAGRKSRGRQKIEIKKIEKESNLQVTFSKRRSGLFKKGGELCTLTGAELAMLVRSPGRKMFTFGHPSVEAIIDRYRSANPNPPEGNTDRVENLVMAFRNMQVINLNAQLDAINEELENEKGNTQFYNQKLRDRQILHWWERPAAVLDYEQLSFLEETTKMFQGTLEEYARVLKEKRKAEIMEMHAQNAALMIHQNGTPMRLRNAVPPVLRSITPPMMQQITAPVMKQNATVGDMGEFGDEGIPNHILESSTAAVWLESAAPLMFQNTDSPMTQQISGPVMQQNVAIEAIGEFGDVGIPYYMRDPSSVSGNGMFYMGSASSYGGEMDSNVPVLLPPSASPPPDGTLNQIHGHEGFY